MNPFQMLAGMKNPQKMVEMMMNNSQLANNPMAKNIFQMVKDGNLRGVEELGRNMAKERGVDFDQAFNDFKSRFPM